MLQSLTREEAFNPSSGFSPGVRSLGDSRCWTILLHSPFESQDGDAHERNRWLVTIDPTRRVQTVNAAVFTSDRLKSAYTVSPCMSYKEMMDEFNRLKQLYPEYQ